jgi:hypothetical protein
MFEDSKVWIFLFLVSVLMSLGYGAHYLSSVDEANLALQESKSKLAGMNEMLFLRKNSWNESDRLINKLNAEADKNATLIKAKDILDLRHSKAQGDLKYSLESMKTSVDKTRNNAPGTEFEEITLANGKTLRGVKIRKVEEQGISLIHTDGIGTIPLDLLPDHLKEQYDLGPNALVPRIQKAQTGLLLPKPEKDSVNERPHLPPNTPSSTPDAKSTVDDSKTKKIKLRMAELDSRITTFSNVLEKYQTSMASHRSLASSALGRGQPSTRHTENANEVLVKATSLEFQLTGLREEREKLNVELECAISGK